MGSIMDDQERPWEARERENTEARALAYVVLSGFMERMRVKADMIRARAEHGGPLKAEEILEGIRLERDDFMRLYELARERAGQKLSA